MSGNGREALPDDQVCLEGLTGGQEAHLDVRKWSGGLHGCPGVVGSPSRMSKSGREALTGGWDSSQMTGSGRETLPHVQEWSVGSPAGREAVPDDR